MDTLDEWAQPTVDPETRAYVTSLVSAIGGTSADDDGKYVLGDDALACLKDLRRWLKLYDTRLNRMDVARCLAETNLVTGDLIEILALWARENYKGALKSKIALSCLELLVPLTWPIEIEDDRFTVNHHRHIGFIQQTQLDYKKIILHYDRQQILRTIVRIALPSIATPKPERTTRDDGIIRLVLYLLRNVTTIASLNKNAANGEEAEISRSATIDAFHEQDIFPVLLTLASSIGVEFSDPDVLLLEVLFHLLKGVDPKKLFMEDQSLAKHQTDELKGLISKEKAMLAGYARNAPTRHNRFGTMIWVKRDDDRVSTVSGQDVLGSAEASFHKMDQSKKWNKPRHRSRRTEDSAQNLFDNPVYLSVSARKRLRSFLEDFLDSSFNPLFSHLRKALESEAQRVLSTHHMQYFYLISWFLQAECGRRAEAKQKRADKTSKTASPEEDESFGLVASVLNQETFVLLNRFLHNCEESKEWQSVNAGMKCLTQILLTVQEMSESPVEEDQEIAENIQNRIFYEQTTHDRVITLLRTYKGQGFGYLDACTELSHVFLRMLERYSKQNVDMQVRSRRRARRARKKKQAGEAGAENNQGNADADPDNLINDGDGQSDGEAQRDVEEATRVISDRKFDFSRFAAKFMTQGCVDTFVTFTRYYRDLSIEQLKRCHRFFHRAAFKMELATMLFRVDVLHLFNKMIKGPDGLDTDSPVFSEWEEFVRHLFRRNIKKVQQTPELVVEMLFGKMSGSVYFLEHGFDKAEPIKQPRPPAELEVKPGMTHEEQVGVAVSVLVDEQKSDLLAWLKTVLQNAEEERMSWEMAEEARKIANPAPPAAADAEQDIVPPTGDSPAQPPTITLTSPNEAIRLALFKDNKLRLLLTLLGLTSSTPPDSSSITWTIPPEISPSDLESALKLIRQSEFAPPTFDDGKSAQDFLRSKKAAAHTRRTRRAAFDDDTSGSDLDADDADLLFPAGGPTQLSKSDALSQLKKTRRRRRKRHTPVGSGSEDDDDEVRAARAAARRKRDDEKRRKIKSALYVNDEDDESDAAADGAFFAREKQLREKTGQRISNEMLDASAAALGAGRKRKAGSESGDDSGSAGKKRRGGGAFRVDLPGSSDEDEDDDGDVADRTSSDDDEDDAEVEPVFSAAALDTGDEMTDSPLSSQAAAVPTATSKAVRSRGARKAGDEAMPDADGKDDDEEEQEPVVKVGAQRRAARGGFVIDSDSE